MRGSPTVLKHGEIFVLADEGGDIGGHVEGAGIYFRDTRHLCYAHLTINGRQPELLDTSAEHNSIGIAQFANPLLQTADHHDILPETVGVRRLRHIETAVSEQLEIHNYNTFRVGIDLELSFAADFRDIFDVRGFPYEQRGRVLLPERDGQTVTLGYRAPDGVRASTVIAFNRSPDHATTTAGESYAAEIEALQTMLPGHDRIVPSPMPGYPPKITVSFHLEIEPGGRDRIEFRLTPSQESSHAIDASFTETTWLSGMLPSIEPFTAVTTSHEVVNHLLDRSLRDLRALITPFPGGQAIAAGIPWYVAPFGRDSLITSLQMMLFSPSLTLETLRFLARYQGTTVNDWTEEEPGKIFHEQRFGEMARRGIIPHTPYYGTVDATPLFIIVFCELMNWTDDHALFDELLPNVQRAMDWIDRQIAADPDGFVRYGRRSRRGLDNQGWKDSDNSLQFPDGTTVIPPIALVEVQGYVYQAKQMLAAVLERFGMASRAATLRRDAAELRQRFEARFWSEADRFYGQAIDGSDRLVPAVSSNPGHALFSGIVTEDRARQVVERLRGPDMFSGWGIRTLSTEMPHYNPMSYHNGSVWPHDNAIIAAGLRRYGYDDDAATVATAIVASARHFDYYRLPELFCGFDRQHEHYAIPITYPVSCSPQAWAAGTLPYLLQILLGMRPDAANRRLVLRPYLPVGLEHVHLHGIRIADQVVTLDIHGHGTDVDVDAHRSHDITVVVEKPTVTLSAGQPTHQS